MVLNANVEELGFPCFQIQLENQGEKMNEKKSKSPLTILKEVIVIYLFRLRGLVGLLTVESFCASNNFKYLSCNSCLPAFVVFEAKRF